MIKRTTYFLLLPLALTACDLAPDAIIPTNLIPESWRSQPAPTEPEPKTITAPTADPETFGSDELKKLTTQALANNTDLAASLARIEQARATTTIAGANLYPSVDASGSLNSSRTRSRGISITDDRKNAALAISYELDLWQRNRNSADSAEFNLRATEFDRDTLRLLVTAEVARLYTSVLANESRISVAQNNLKNAQDIMRITTLRYREGAVSGLEEAQQRTSVANTEASLASLKNQRDLAINELATIIGTAPTNLQLNNQSKLTQLQLPNIKLASPWQLIARRPDIAAAESRLRAANIDIGIARAAALPSLSTAFNASISGSPKTTATSLAASFFAPIFHSGALQAEIDRSKAARDESLTTYQATLLTAFREVEDAISNLEAANTRRDRLNLAAQQARRAYTIARARFDAGSTDFTTLLSIQASLFQSEDSHTSAIQEQLAAHIDLIRALGGPAN